MSHWFEGECKINCTIREVERAAEDHGTLFAGVVSLMPGLTTVELMEQGPDFVTIRTNEGLMNRTNISKNTGADRLTMEFDEKYEAGSKVTATSHFSEEFAPSDTGVTYRLVMSDVAAPGLMGFFYRTFGSSKTGNAFLTATKAYLENKHE